MPRRTAFKTLLKIENERAYSHITLDQNLSAADLSPLDTSLATILTYNCLTWQSAIDTIIKRHLHGNFSQLDKKVLTLLRLGTCQAHFLDRIPDHAVVNESVEMCKEFAPEAVPMVNAVLRKITENKEPWYDQSISSQRDARKPAKWLASRWALPTWLANRIVQQFKDDADDAAQALQKRPPLYIRKLMIGESGASEEKVGDSEKWRDIRKVDAVEGAYSIRGVARDRDAEGVPVFGDHRWIVQDLGSQLVGWFAAPVDAEKVLDACAGLGGKTFQLFECCDHVTAVEPNASKLGKLNTSKQLEFILLSRPSGKPYAQASRGTDLDNSGKADKRRTFVSHLGTLKSFFEASDETFDHILVDAPCTGLGVIRRHPETKWMRKESDIQALAAVQADLLELAATRVRTGGTLVYSVCTFTAEETHKQIERFLEAHSNWSLDTDVEKTLKGIPAAVGWPQFLEKNTFLRVYPHIHNTDAFFAARLRRNA